MNKLIIIVLPVMLSGCVTTGTTGTCREWVQHKRLGWIEHSYSCANGHPAKKQGWSPMPEWIDYKPNTKKPKKI